MIEVIGEITFEELFGLAVMHRRGDFQLTVVEIGLSCAAAASDLNLRFWGVESPLDRAMAGMVVI